MSDAGLRVVLYLRQAWVSMTCPIMSVPHATPIGPKADIGTIAVTGSGIQNDDGTTTRKCERTLFVQIGGCLSALHHMGPDAGTWRPNEGKHAQLFGLVDGPNGVTDGNMDASISTDIASATNALRNVNILKVCQCTP